MESLKILEKIITSWNVEDVIEWLKHINFSQYEKEFRENNISGDILIHLDHESLKEIGILSAGHRLSFLKAIYRIKVDQDILIEPEHYIPISVEIDELGEYDKLGTSEITKLTQIIRSHDKHLTEFEEEIKTLKKNLSKVQEDISSIFKIIKDFKQPESPVLSHENSSFSAKFQEKPLQLKAISTHSQVSPTQLGHGLDSPIFTEKTQNCQFLTSNIQNNQIFETVRKNSEKNKEEYFINKESQSPISSQKSHESIEMFKSFRVGLNDPCRKVLLAALKKYKINSDWKEYALVLYYDNKERYIELDEKPLLLFQKLQKDEKKPIFMLKKIKKPVTLSQNSNSIQETKTESDMSNTFENIL
ncbi:hypothetical protein PORY_001908 [Pneumocystis oryctolagi]|uniref:Uncharacterized protein n=1 Tax=Pneumocystis oryctolagi TaxID=42067 RepID=A0ACB7CCT1_9ASCO|nr:hypothetical protein PORY_001908 [Pneumocystis oryctolagi]